MITHCLIEAGLDPHVPDRRNPQHHGTNARAGAGPHAVAEVDESDGSHLNLPGTWWSTTSRWTTSTTLGARRHRGDHGPFVAENAQLETLALNWDDAGVRALAEHLDRPFLRYGTVDGPLDFAARDVEDLGIASASWRTAGTRPRAPSACPSPATTTPTTPRAPWPSPSGP
ncbi:MAG: hypothetical protein R3F60_31160 [bacterium]